MIATILKTRYHIAGKLGDGGIPAYERVCIFEDLGALFAGRKPAKASKVYARER